MSLLTSETKNRVEPATGNRVILEGNSHKRLLVSAALASMFLFSSPVSSEESAAVIRGPYLQLATPDAITVVWRSDKPIDPVVRYGLKADKQVQEESDNVFQRIAPVVDSKPDKHFARLHSAAPNTYQYEMTLTGLEPETKYFYSVWDGDKPLVEADKDLFFETHPQAGDSRATRLWVVGDSGNGTPTQHKVYEAARNFVKETNNPIDLYLHVGDMAYESGEDDEFQKNFFDIYQPTLQNTVVWPTMGNHEGFISTGITADGPYYDAYVSPTGGEAGGVPSGTEAYYSFDYGNIHFICLDSHDLDRFPNGLMAQWLERDLQSTRADWLIAFWHHAPYTKGSHDSDIQLQGLEMREQIMPILEKYGVDLVLTGHSHIYERSMLVDKAYHTPTTSEGVVLDDGDGHIHGDGAYHKSHGLNPHEGTAHIVTGHGGGATSARRGVMPIMRQSMLEHGSVIVDIEGDMLTAKMIGGSGQIRDEFHLVKKGRVKPKIVKQPWSPVGPEVTPAGGPFPEVPVAIAHSGYWEDGEIHYTLDGTEPTRESARYKGPIELPQDASLVTLKAASFKGKKLQPSLASTAKYKAFGPDIPLARNRIAVDGKLDDWAQWQGEPIVLDETTLNEGEETGVWGGPDDLSADIKLAWRKEGLYFAVTVTDDVYLPAEHDMVIVFDNLTFMVDGRGAENRTDSTMGQGAYMTIVSADVSGEGHRSLSYTPMFDNYTYAAQRTERGYVAEFFVPFSEKLFPDQGFKAGREIQLAVSIIDQDGPDSDGANVMAWGALVAEDIIKSTTYWKPMRLAE
ncbi:hypothetical protein HBA55_22320 [Pseudomaricurvus alkylphenolicus]|uniref:metallophosphoesterase n=1 Tax=Pseudomaricurvus alkylphenolicus TaxID=1306991 RepID=UPI00141E625F|nr:metallophosphoesterase [Pseudomaricurvus alkylphenolicus]NIB42359.1 hypothetical protein [Pseudomaricurvus alkylphenolicus]